MTRNFVFRPQVFRGTSWLGTMNDLKILISGAVLLLAAAPVVAQHQHGGGAPAGGGGFAVGYSPAASDFQKAIALQATESQSTQIRSWVQNTSVLTQHLEEIRNASIAVNARDLSGEREALVAALATDKLDRQQFLASLSKPQRSGLKRIVGRLDKVDRALAKALSDLTNSGQSQNAKLFVKELEEAKRAVSLEKHSQQELADEMGVTVQGK